MADNKKKIYRIEINGVEESLNAVKALNDQLNDLDNRLKNLQKAKVDIKVSGNEGKTKVSGNNDNDTKVVKQLEQEKQKLASLTNAEYQSQYQELVKIKAISKDIAKEQENIAKGVKTIDGEYANTLQGQRAYLADLKKQLASTELGTEEWEELGQKVLKVNDYVKELEYSFGVFTRNVGNYKSASEGFGDMVNQTKQYQNTIESLNEKIGDLNSKLRTLEGGSKEFQETASQIKEAKTALQELENQIDVAGNAMENKLGVKFKTTIEGVEYVFDDVNQAVGLLEDKLYSMAQSGERNTKTYKAITEEIIRLRNVVRQTDASIDSMVGTSRGLGMVMQVVKGFTSLASVSQGVQMLFGGQNKELDQSIQKFMGLSLVLQGVSAVQQEIANETTVMSKAWQKIGDWIKPLTNQFDKFKEKLDDTQKKIQQIQETDAKWDNANTQFKNVVNSVDEVREAYSKLNNAQKAMFRFLLTTKNGLNLLNYENFREKAPELAKFIDVVNKAKEDNEEFAKSFDEATNEFRGWSKEMEKAEKSWRSLDKITKKVVGSSIPLVKTFANGVLWLGKAFANAMKTIATSTVVLLAVQLAIEGVTWLIEKATNLWDTFTKGQDALKGSSDILNSSLERQAEELAKVNKELERAIELGKKSKFDTLKEELKILQDESVKTGNALKEFVTIQERMQKLGKRTKDIKDIGKLRQEYLKNLKDIQNGQGDMDKLKEQQKDVIALFRQEMTSIDFSKPQEAVEKFRVVIDDELYSSALANVEKVFEEEEWAKMFTQLVDQYKSAIDQIKDKEHEWAVYNKQTLDTIEDNQIQAIANRMERDRKQMALEKKRELDNAKGNAKLIESINAKYKVKELELSKNQAREIRAIEQSIENNKIATMAEGWAKRKAQLELQRQQEIDNAKDSGIKVQEQIKAIDAKYDKLMLDEKDSFYRELEEKTRSRNESLLNLQLQYARNTADLWREIQQDILKNQEKQLSNENIGVGQNLRYNEKDIESIKQYYTDMLKLQNDYNEKKRQLDIQNAVQENENNITDENRRYQDRKKELEQNLYDQSNVLKDALKNNEISQEEYNNAIERLNRDVNEQIEDNEKVHNAKIVVLKEDLQNTLTEIEKNGIQERFNLNATTINNTISQFNDYLSRIQELKDRNTTNNVNQFGLINIKKERQNLNEAKEEYSKLLKNIDDEYTNLQNKLNNNEITFGDFQSAKAELDSLKNNTQDSLRDVTLNLKNFGVDSAKNIADVAVGYMSQIGELYSMFNDIMMMNFDAEQAELDRQKDFLSKEEEALEQSYQKQQEITERYTDKINSIEDELAESRGERRQHLIDQLAQQREAQLQSLATETEIQAEKSANEQKQRAIEKQQDALDKKRKQQEKKMSIVQATINTATAVSNALAVQPWFLGVALATIASTLGAIQIAKIRQQKYADGGLLQGRSHSQGGIPVGNSGIEVEGNEYVVNKRTTMANLPMMAYINGIRREITAEDMERYFREKNNVSIPRGIKRFADGGQLNMNDANLKDSINGVYQDNRPIVVSVVDIINKTENLKTVQTLAGL